MQTRGADSGGESLFEIYTGSYESAGARAAEGISPKGAEVGPRLPSEQGRLKQSGGTRYLAPTSSKTSTSLPELARFNLVAVAHFVFLISKAKKKQKPMEVSRDKA